ncbi:MAG: lysophospholipid acyltransferase family protein [Ilumatobacteraceae bacterium]
MADRTMGDSKGPSRQALRRAAKVGDLVAGPMRTVLRPTAKVGFPYRKPTVPRGVVVPEEASKLGADYDTDWARRPLAKAARTAIHRGPLQAAVKALADPEGARHRPARRPRAAGRRRAPADLRPQPLQPSRHADHVGRSARTVARQADGGRCRRLLLRHALEGCCVGARAERAADRPRGDGPQVGRHDPPVDRRRLQPRDLPRGRPLPDGWGQEFKGGAAYLSIRTGAPVVPVFIDGTDAIFGKGMKRPKPGTSRVVFGRPLRPEPGESTRRFNARIEAAVTMLGDESLTDAWTARRRAATGTNPKLTGPEYTGWRRQWALTDRRELGSVGVRRRQKRRWPDLG